MNSSCALIVFAKAPVPGYAKTRLARAIGNEAAARLAGRMLAETVNNAVAADIGPVELCCAPDESHPAFLGTAATHGLALTRQGNGDLGVRMHRALERTLRTYPRAMLIGTDAPSLGPQQLRNAARLLRSHQAVFGPAADGGYVLVGLSAPEPHLFEGIEWSTPRVMAQTRERADQLGLVLGELPTLADVDEPEDLVHVPKEWLE
jgi:rSAM/selenodomain-associated transferase 1